jgi:hypothetical protein
VDDAIPSALEAIENTFNARAVNLGKVDKELDETINDFLEKNIVPHSSVAPFNSFAYRLDNK